MPGRAFSRREFLGAAGLSALGVACGRSRPARPPSVPPGSIAALTAGTETLSLLGTGQDAAPMNPGDNRLGFDLVTSRNQLIGRGVPQVWLSRDQRGKAQGPFPATWYPFTGYASTGDRSPQSPIPGVFATGIDLPSSGFWTVAATLRSGSRRMAGTGVIEATDGPVVAGLGSKATSTPTPVATTDAKIAEICTRTPVDHLHHISLDEALKNGKPTVACFSTPLLCQSMLCGPVTDELILVSQKYGPDTANLIHVEEFLPGPDRRPPGPTLENRSPAFKAWRLESEPWVVAIDRSGVIRFRSLGPVTAPEIERALTALL